MNKELFCFWGKINGSFISNCLSSLHETINSSIILVSQTLSVETRCKVCHLVLCSNTVFIFLAISSTL